ncbi:MAG TPA: YfiR family protein [Accumulibacter sp.]|nr:YfiR family protein [Accumulibacter sp.]
MTRLIVALSLACLPTSGWSQSASQREDRIKAALVFKLVKFVDWPAAAMAGRDPVQICSLGESHVAEALAAIDGKPIRDRLAQFRKITTLTVNEVRGCHVLYIPASAREASGSVSAVLRGKNVLTIGDAPDFARRGGMIGLIQSENKLSFEINLRVARESSLEPGAPLLELATVIE